MKQNVVEVIVYLLEIASSYPLEIKEGEIAPMVIKQRLEDAGFAKDVVVHAFDWLKELIERQRWYAQTKHPGTPTNKTLRIFSPGERIHLDLEVRNFILSLEYAGILDTNMREIIINQLMQLDQLSIDLVDAKWVVLLVLMSKSNKNVQELHRYLLAIWPEGYKEYLW
ncbi:MAG: DUF494 domain-containing protein [Coxiellaceae bacterium]|jgi:Smg protein|nr:DUF494 domain-containing protein [Coxiellaceae bacterium]